MTQAQAVAILRDAARQIRAEERRIADVRHDIRRAAITRRRWSGPAAERFESSIRRRIAGLGHHQAGLHYLASRLEDAANGAAAVKAVQTSTWVRA